MPEDSKSPQVPNPLHPQAKSLGKNRLNNPPKKGKDTVSAPAATPNTPTVAAASAPKPAPKPEPPKESVSPPPSAPGKDRSFFEMTIAINGSDAPPFTVETPLTGNGANDQASAKALARKKFPGKAMTVLGSRIYTKTENALSQIPPGATLSSLFGATGGQTEDLIEVGRAFYDGSRGTLFLRNMRSHVGLTFRPGSGGLAVFSNRIVSNRLASELPLIVAEILGNNAREIQIYLK